LNCILGALIQDAKFRVVKKQAGLEKAILSVELQLLNINDGRKD